MKTKWFNRVLAIAVALCLVIGMVPATALADGQDDPTPQAESDSGELITTEEALREAVANGGSVTLGGNIDLASTLTIPAGVTVELDLNGYTIACTTRSIDTIYNYGNLTIIDSSNSGEGKITNSAATNIASGKYLLHNAGTVEIVSGTFDSKYVAVGNEKAGTLVISGGTFKSATYTIANSGKMSITGGSITSTSTSHYAITNKGSSANMEISGGTISATNCAIWNYNVATMTISGDVSVSAQKSYAVENQNSQLTIEKGEFTAAADGVSAVHCTSGTVTILDGTFIAADGSDAVAAGTNGTLTASGGNYSSKLDTSYLAEGYTQDESGTVSGGTKTYVAQVGTEQYETLAEAITAAQAGDTVTLLEDILLDPTAVADATSEYVEPLITIDKNLTLDLSGHSIKLDQNKLPANMPYTPAIFGIQSSVTITGDGLIDAEAGYNNSYGINVNGGSLTIESGTFTGAPTAVQVQTGSLTINGGSFDLADTIKSVLPAYAMYIINAIDENWDKRTAQISIAGGTFGYDYSSYPSESAGTYVADGYEMVQNDDGTYGVQAAKVAQVKDAEGNVTETYAALNDAITAATAGQTVQLLIDTAETVSIAQGQNITLDLNGKTLTTNITLNGSLTVRDSSEDAKGVITNSSDSGLNSYTVAVKAGGCLTLESGTIKTVVASKYAVQVNGSASVTTDGFAMTGGQVIAESGKTTYAGAALYIGAHAHATISGGVIKNSTDQTSTDYYAMYAAGNSYCTVSGGTFEGYVRFLSTATRYNITGGTYTVEWTDGDKSKVADGYVFKAADGGRYQVVAGELDETTANVALTIDGTTTYYYTVANALTYLSQYGNSGTIKLLKDLSEGATIAEGQNIILDLNGKTLSGMVIVNGGNLTVKDSTAVEAGPVVNDRDLSVSYSFGKITYTTDPAVKVQNGGTFVLESGTIESTSDSALWIFGNEEAANEPICSQATIKGGYIVGQEFGVGVEYAGAELTVAGGVIVSKDNAAVAGNGALEHGGTTMNINGGTLIGHIQSPDYIACGIYHPQDGVLNITGGTIYADGGVGVLMRGGELTMTGGKVIASGTASGKVGDSSIIANCYGILLDGAAGYYDIANTKVDISENASVSAGTDVAALMVTDKNGTTGTIAVSGGTFSSEVPEEYCADGFEPVTVADENGMYTVQETVAAVAQIGDKTYPTLDEAINAVQPGETIQLLADVTLSDSLTVSTAGTLDLNGHLLTIKENIVMTVEADLAIINSGATMGGVTNNGDIKVASGKLDLSKLGYGEANTGGLTKETNGTMHVSADATVVLLNAWVESGWGFLTHVCGGYGNPNAVIAEVGAFAVYGTETYICTASRESTSEKFDTWQSVVAQVLDANGSVVSCGTLEAALSAATSAATSGQTVQLLQDVTVDNIKVEAGVTLDLNGNNLTVTGNLISFGIVKDSVADTPNGGEPGLLVASDLTYLTGDGQKGILPIGNSTDGYRLFSYTLMENTSVPGDGTVKFRFKLLFTNQDAYNYIANVEFDFNMKGVLTVDEPAVNLGFDYNDTLKALAAVLKTAEQSAYSLTLNVTGLEELGGKKLTFTVTLGLGTLENSIVMTYDIPEKLETSEDLGDSADGE